MKFQQKIFLSYLFFISFFSAVIAGTLYFYFSGHAMKELLNSAEKTYAQTFTLLNYQFKQYMNASYIVNYSEEITSALNLPRKELADSPGKQNLEALHIRNAVTKSILPLSDTSMRIYVDDAFSYVLDHNVLESLDKMEEYPWYQEFVDDRSLTLWQTTMQTDSRTLEKIPSLSFFRKVDTQSSLGWISEIYIEMSDLQDILKGADPTGNGAVFLQKEDDMLLCGTDEELCDRFTAEYGSSYRKEKSDWKEITLNEKEYRIYWRTITSTGWYLILLLPSYTAHISLYGLARYVLLIFLAVIIVSVLAARIFTHSFSWRLLKLNEKMAALCGGDLDTRIEEQGNDEISHVFRSFNHMANELKHLVHQQYENGIMVKAAELKALQAQINPHFLYNTLELINWKAMESDAPEIVEITQDLAGFYRLTLNNGRSMVLLHEEIEQVMRYVDIQNFRFSQEIRMVLDIPEDCMTVSVPKLTLQPLIENCIMHGFIPREEAEEQNRILINAFREGKELFITVTDNGVGMTQEQLEEILSEKRINQEHGFGVFNVQQRIQMLYGKDYGLTYELTGEGGVSVTIRLKV